MSMDDARSRFPECVSCNEGVDENNPALGHHVDESGEYWHATCYAKWESNQEGPEPDYDYVRYEDSPSYRQSMTDAGRGHLLP